MKKNFSRFITFAMAAFAVVMLVSCGTKEPEESKPAAAGTITGSDSGEDQIVLTIGEITHAATYKWYRDGKEVQNTSSRTYTATVSGTYKVAGVNPQGEGTASPNKVITITASAVPADAGVISSDGTESDDPIELTIATIARAATYKWYKDGVEVQNTESRTYTATTSGLYKVAGVNSKGEGGASPERRITINSLVPGNAGDITVTGGILVSEDPILLRVNAIARATTYKWYKDGVEVQNNNERSYTATASGAYKVAGVNSAGEGAASSEVNLSIEIIPISVDDMVGTWTSSGILVCNNHGWGNPHEVVITKVNDTTIEMSKFINLLDPETGEPADNRTESPIRATINPMAKTITIPYQEVTNIFFSTQFPEITRTYLAPFEAYDQPAGSGYKSNAGKDYTVKILRNGDSNEKLGFQIDCGWEMEVTGPSGVPEMKPTGMFYIGADDNHEPSVAGNYYQLGVIMTKGVIEETSSLKPYRVNIGTQYKLYKPTYVIY